jgi:hypothetical protein
VAWRNRNTNRSSGSERRNLLIIWCREEPANPEARISVKIDVFEYSNNRIILEDFKYSKIIKHFDRASFYTSTARIDSMQTVPCYGKVFRFEKNAEDLIIVFIASRWLITAQDANMYVMVGE